MKIYVARHGKTVWNEQRRTQGQVQNRLSKTGIETTQKLAEKSKDIKIDYIYSSPLLRAVQTANIINKFHKVKVIKDQRLTDINQGIFSGRFFDSLTEEELIAKKSRSKKYGMESMEEFFIRIKDFYNFILEKHKHENILIVTHSGAIKLLEYVTKHNNFNNELLEQIKLLDNSIIKQII